MQVYTLGLGQLLTGRLGHRSEAAHRALGAYSRSLGCICSCLSGEKSLRIGLCGSRSSEAH